MNQNDCGVKDMQTRVAGEAMAATASPWLTVKESAARARCGVKMIYRAVAGHKLRAVKVGTALRIHVAWLDAWLEAQATVVNADAPGPALAYQPWR